jgi:mannose PTS system EIIA component
MIGILIVAHGSLGESLITCVSHVLGTRPPLLEHLDVTRHCEPAAMLAAGQELTRALDQGDGVLVLADMYGATPCNTACRLVVPGRVEAVAGVNLPMLIRALTYRNESLDKVLAKALSGGHNGILHITASFCDAAKGD